MYRKVLLSGMTAAAIIGAGGTALALSGSDTTSGTPSGSAASSSTSTSGKAGTTGKATKAKAGGTKGKLLKHLTHAQIVTKGKDGTFVTHDLILGTVTAVAPTSITVQAADKTSETFSVSSTTTVRRRTTAKAKPTASSISKVVKGDTVLVAGTGTSHYAAKRVIDLPR